MTYRAPRWLPGGHLQTIYPAKFAAKPHVRYRRERWDIHDPTLGDDFVDVDFVDGAPGNHWSCCSTGWKVRRTAITRAA